MIIFLGDTEQNEVRVIYWNTAYFGHMHLSRRA